MSFGEKRGKQAAGSLQTDPERDDLNRAAEISCQFLREQAVRGGSQAYAGDQGERGGEWDIPPGDFPHVYLSWGHTRHTHSFLNSGGIALTESWNNYLRCSLSISKRPSPSPPPLPPVPPITRERVM